MVEFNDEIKIYTKVKITIFDGSAVPDYETYQRLLKDGLLEHHIIEESI